MDTVFVSLRYRGAGWQEGHNRPSLDLKPCYVNHTAETNFIARRDACDSLGRLARGQEERYRGTTSTIQPLVNKVADAVRDATTVADRLEPGQRYIGVAVDHVFIGSVCLADKETGKPRPIHEVAAGIGRRVAYYLERKEMWQPSTSARSTMRANGPS